MTDSITNKELRDQVGVGYHMGRVDGTYTGVKTGCLIGGVMGVLGGALTTLVISAGLSALKPQTQTIEHATPPAATAKEHSENGI